MIMESKNKKIGFEMLRVFKTLGDENRYHILMLLNESNLCVGALARILNISKPAVSQHLKLLREAGLVKGEKIGYFTHYRVEKGALIKAAHQLQEMAESSPPDQDHNGYICLKSKDNETPTERRTLPMCENCCEKPEKLKIKPEACTPEQIKECHGDENNHPCECDKKE
jgi:ArsR family transcriptional regulator, arsenate/arsenite/antimonite-responsive transcriptional repressor